MGGNHHHHHRGGSGGKYRTREVVVTRPRSPSVPPPDAAAAVRGRLRARSPSVPPPDAAAAVRGRLRARSPSVPPPDVVVAADRNRRRARSPVVPPPDNRRRDDRRRDDRRRDDRRRPPPPPPFRGDTRNNNNHAQPKNVDDYYNCDRDHYFGDCSRNSSYNDDYCDRDRFRGDNSSRRNDEYNRDQFRRREEELRRNNNAYNEQPPYFRRDLSNRLDDRRRERAPLAQQQHQYHRPAPSSVVPPLLPPRQLQQYHHHQQEMPQHWPPPAAAALPPPSSVVVMTPPPPLYPPPAVATTPEEQQAAADMVRTVLPFWRSERVGGKVRRVWGFDPRVCCWNASMVVPGCVDARTCRCTPLPGAPALSRTILHDLLPKALPVLGQPTDDAASAALLAKDDGEEGGGGDIFIGDEAAADDAAVSAALAKDDDGDEEGEEAAEEENWSLPPILEYPLMDQTTPQQQTAHAAPPPDDLRLLLGNSSGQLAFRNGVLFAGRRFVAAARGMPPPSPPHDDDVFDQTCAFPFEYAPFDADRDGATLAALRRVLLDRFWGADADVFLAYLAAAYTGSARGKMVISAPGASPPLICTSDNAQQQRIATERHVVAQARWERYRNTGPQYLELLLRAVHGDDNSSSSTSHVVECDTYRRFTRRMPLADCQAWAAARAHHRLMWMRPNDSELVFMPSVHQPGAPAFGPAGRGDRSLASLRKLQALARIDAPRTMELLSGNNNHPPPAFAAFLMWPRPVLPVLDGFVAPNAPGTLAAENCWSQPLAARLRTVTHTAWSTEDTTEEKEDWTAQLDQFMQNTPRDVLRRVWVELLLRAAETEGVGNCWPRQSRLSPFVIGPLGYPAEMLAQPRASDLALMQIAPRAARLEAVRQDNFHRGLVPRSGTCWEQQLLVQKHV